MKPFRFSMRSALVLCLAVSAIGLAACSGRSPTPADAVRLHVTLGDFSVFSPEPAAQTPMSPVYVSHKRADITQNVDPMRAVSASPPTADFPLPGCASMTVALFTGGANCCFGYYILTHCPDSDHAGYVEPRNGGIGEAQPSMAAYVAADAAFFYYSPAGQTGDNRLSLSRADSPSISRYLVFDNGLWRADRPGEFPAAYTALLAQLNRETRMNPTAKAIATAYYSLMAGKKANAASRALARSLPDEYAKLSPVVFADIQAAVATFDPVRNVTIGK